MSIAPREGKVTTSYGDCDCSCHYGMVVHISPCCGPEDGEAHHPPLGLDLGGLVDLLRKAQSRPDQDWLEKGEIPP